MDREYLEERLSAYIDGELSTEDKAKFEIELQKHPDLSQLVKRMRKLDALAKSADVEMPDEKYFDQLATRIEAKLPQKGIGQVEDEPRKRARIIDFLAVNRKTVSIVGSAAAVLLVALIGVQIYGPSTPKYPKEIRRYEIEPAIDRKKVDKLESPKPIALPDSQMQGEPGRQVQPVPEVEESLGTAERDDADAAKQKLGDPDKLQTESREKADVVHLESEYQAQSIQLRTNSAAEQVMMLDSSMGVADMAARSVALGGEDRIVTTQGRLAFDSLRAFAYSGLGYTDVPAPDQFAVTVMDSLERNRGGAVANFQAKSLSKDVPTSSKSLTGAGLNNGEDIQDPDKRDLLARAEIAYQIAASDSSNVFDIIYARLLSERVARFSTEKAAWARRLMELSRLEAYERKRWSEANK